MFFGDLRNALLESIRIRVRNGELTERGLAKLLGISQPHLHNVLKGTRCLSVEMCDRFLAQLRLSTLDLVDLNLLRRQLGSAEAGPESCSYLPVLQGKLGPADPWPQQVEKYERFPIPMSVTARMLHPVVVRLSADLRMEPLFADGDALLLDQSSSARTEIEEHALYVVKRGGVGAVRRLRKSGEALYAVTEDALDRPAAWEGLPVDSRPVPYFVKARATLLTPEIQWIVTTPAHRCRAALR
jgi:hypothetical protein